MNRIRFSIVSFMLFGLVLGFTQSTTARQDERVSRVIHLVERAHSVSFQDVNPPGPSLGDLLVFSSDMYDRTGNLVGRDGVHCITVRIDASAPADKQQVVQCVASVELFSEGQITAQSLAQGTENFFAITGGTGRFRTARGEIFVKDITPLVEANVTITLYDSGD